jgi:hypothetical protein
LHLLVAVPRVQLLAIAAFMVAATITRDRPDAAGSMRGPPVVLHRQRWVMLAAFCLLSALNGCMWIQFASVSTLCQRLFGTSALSVDGFSRLRRGSSVIIPFSFLFICRITV